MQSALNFVEKGTGIVRLTDKHKCYRSFCHCMQVTLACVGLANSAMGTKPDSKAPEGTRRG